MIDAQTETIIKLEAKIKRLGEEFKKQQEIFTEKEGAYLREIATKEQRLRIASAQSLDALRAQKTKLFFIENLTAY